MSNAAILVQVWRGSHLESAHRGHGVVCDARGTIRAAWGDPAAIIYPRSSCKMLQALPLLESGAGRELSSERLALACASHQGAQIHVERVARWLADLDLSESDLRCGAQVPDDKTERHRLRDSNDAPTQLHNNCSGKHTGFLMLARHLRASPDYVDPAHKVQRDVRTAFEEMTGLESPGYGIDGCAAPNFLTTVHGLAHAMARMADPSGLGAVREAAVRRLNAAMLGHPLLVAGERRACTELMEASGRTAIAKTGAEGVFTAILPRQGLGVALKVEDGHRRASECAIAAILARLGVLSPQDPAVARRLTPPVTNRIGSTVGRIAPEPAFWSDGTPL
ncbi:asparaginase [Amaricoccus macauensis]|uniref:asparaginase n=1 Tax=Amaricoccus macauensis TaxID=57001 RepID=UPI003C7E231E